MSAIPMAAITCVVAMLSLALAKARPGALNYASTATGGTPHLAAELFKSNTEDARKRLLEAGIEPVGSTPEQFAAKLESETLRMDRVIKAAGIRMD